MSLFLEQGYEAVGIRQIAAEADVAVTTLFAHFPSKESLVFEQAAGFEERLREAVLERTDARSVIDGLRREIAALVQHCTTGDAVGVWQMIEASPELASHAQVLELRYARVVADALGDRADVDISTTAAHTIARFALASFTIARKSPRPRRALDESFALVAAAWSATTPE